MIHFSFQKSYGGSIFSFFEIVTDTEDDEEIDLADEEE
jgi:hypothetical protein